MSVSKPIVFLNDEIHDAKEQKMDERRNEMK
jgi:hypothetical protein